MSSLPDGWGRKWLEKFRGQGQPVDCRRYLSTQSRERGWYFVVMPRRVGAGYLAMAKRERFRNGNPILESGELWFETAITAEAALVALKREVFAL